MTGNRVTHPDRMYVVAFVEEMTKEHNIVQAAMSCETVPYPPIYEAKAKIRYSLPYNKLAHEDLVTHVLQIENPDNYEILVTPKFHRISSGQDA